MNLDTIIATNTLKQTTPAYTPPARFLHIYDLGNGKFALGERGEPAVYVVRRIKNRTDRLGRGLPTYKGVQARRPRIPADATLIRREDAGRLMLRAFGIQ